MAKNNFQRLEEEIINRRSSDQIRRSVQSNIEGSVSFIQMVGKIIEVYLPRVFDVFVLMGGGERNEIPPSSPTPNGKTPPSLGGTPPGTQGRGPRGF